MSSQASGAPTSTLASGRHASGLGAAGLPADVTASDAALRRFLHGLRGVDQVGAEARAATLAARSVKREAKRWALDAAIPMVDLTTLEGADTPGKVAAMCPKARRPDPADPSVPAAAVCVYPDLVTVAAKELAGAAVLKVILDGQPYVKG